MMKIKKYLAKMALSLALLGSAGCNDPQAVAYFSSTAGGLAGGMIGGTVGAGVGSALFRMGGVAIGGTIGDTMYQQQNFVQQPDYKKALASALQAPDSLSTNVVTMPNEQTVRLSVEPRQINGLGQTCRGYKAQALPPEPSHPTFAWQQKPLPEEESGIACQNSEGKWTLLQSDI